MCAVYLTHTKTSIQPLPILGEELHHPHSSHGIIESGRGSYKLSHLINFSMFQTPIASYQVHVEKQSCDTDQMWKGIMI